MHKKILVVAAHPDDEILGCGGTIMRHVSTGDRVRVMILAEGLTSRDAIRNVEDKAKELSQLHEAAAQAAQFMGVERVEIYDFPDNRMDGVQLLDVIKKVEIEIERFKPDTVYTHHAGDVNVDHQRAHEAVVTACRPLPGSVVREILFFETPSSTEWQTADSNKFFYPNVFVDIEAFIERKLEALHFYESEMRAYPHSRSYEAIKILAQQRGYTIGHQYAEAFMLGRMIRADHSKVSECTGGGWYRKVIAVFDADTPIGLNEFGEAA